MALFRRGMHFGSYGDVDDGAAVFARLATAVEQAEAAGFDALSVPDHVLQNDIAGGRQSPMFEAYTLLGALAARTTSALLYALVSPVTLRNPAVLAKAVTTLDVISGGRAVLGLGAGWDVAEHEAYGIDFPGVKERMDRLDEALTICRSLFREEKASFAGAHYRLHEAVSSPRPVRGDLPILVGGSGEQRTLALVARHADACNVFGDPATARHKLDVLERHCERVGRDPAEITKTAFIQAADDLSEFAAQVDGLRQVGIDGVVLIGTFDPVRIAALGAVLVDLLP
jgi:F420-dependent oxidoreductase-like protein